MKNHNQQKILKDSQIKKFQAYGFLKNLKFFEPYIIIYLMSHNMNLFQIGILVAVREVIINVFEIPSGFIADYYGRKKELYFCFSFYIVSFIAFFFSQGFYVALIGMIFFGLGEAFRSGTHKAMIYTYLDKMNWQEEKAFVYGRTRSASLIGSSLSGIIGIILIINAPTDNYIFIFSTIPYILDFLLISTYPGYLDQGDKTKMISIKEMFNIFIKSFRNSPVLRHVVIEEGITEAVVSYAKDLIQPIMEVIVVGSGIAIISTMTAEENLKVILGIVYAILNLAASVFSKKAYLLKKNKTSMECLGLFHLGFGLMLGLLAIFSNHYILVCIIYMFVFICHNMRKPIYIDEIDNLIEKSTRATMLSISAQLKSLFLMIGAPCMGYIADTYGIGITMMIMAAIFFITIPLLSQKHLSEKHN